VPLRLIIAVALTALAEYEAIIAKDITLPSRRARVQASSRCLATLRQ
jgi:hypothetical protein